MHRAQCVYIMEVSIRSALLAWMQLTHINWQINIHHRMCMCVCKVFNSINLCVAARLFCECEECEHLFCAYNEIAWPIKLNYIATQFFWSPRDTRSRMQMRWSSHSHKQKKGYYSIINYILQAYACAMHAAWSSATSYNYGWDAAQIIIINTNTWLIQRPNFTECTQ